MEQNLASQLNNKNQRPSFAEVITPIAANAAVAVALSIYVIWGNKVSSGIDRTDFIIEFLSAITSYVLFVAVCFLTLTKNTRLFLLLGLSCVEFGRVIDALDEIILFDAGFWSVFGDVLTLIGELLVAYAAIRFLLISNTRADTDPLTGLFNRRYHERMLERLMRNRPSGAGLAVIALDLDNFKAVNDIHGHQAGDNALINTARVLQNCSRDQDVVSRVGGEEFELLVTIRDDDQATTIAERIKAGLEASTPLGLDRLTASIGVAIYKPTETGNDLRGRADAAVYASKKNGKNQVTLAE